MELPDVALRSLEISFFLSPNRTRLTRLKKMAAKVGDAPSTYHRLGATFAPTESVADFVVSAHIGEFSDADEGNETTLHVDLAFLQRSPEPTSSPSRSRKKTSPKRRTDAPPSAEWFFAELNSLIGEPTSEPRVVFFTAALSMLKQAPPPIIAAPQTFGTVTLPVQGVEYGIDTIVGDGVFEFGWRREGPDMLVRLSYATKYEPGMIEEAWTQQRDAIGGYVREGLGR